MKKPIIILLLCISCICSFGQVKLHNENEGMLFAMPDRTDTVYLWNGESNKWVELIDSIADNFNPQDTIPVILLVSKMPTGLRQDGFFRDSSVYWIKGYEVSEYGVIHKDYLDEDKKPIAKNIIIWQVK